MWVPYYSVHFNDAQVGLNVYNLVRQFSLLRQLSPPTEMITVTEAYLDSIRPADPREHKEWNERNMSRVGQIMQKKERAKVLLNQKATSIADVAFALQQNAEHIINGHPGPAKPGYKTLKARKRRRAALNAAEELAEKRSEQISALEEQLQAQVRADTSSPAEGKVRILWDDIYDAQHAEEWPEYIDHGQLRWTRNHIIGMEDVYITDGSFEERT